MRRKKLRTKLLITSCLWPLAAFAEDSDFELDSNPKPAAVSKPVLVNEAGTSVGAITGAKGRFDRYRGGHEDGAQSSSWFAVQERATGKDDGTFYLQAEADGIDIGKKRFLPDASALLRFGEQGTWDFKFNYDGLSFLQSDNYHTAFGSSGELLNGLTPRSINTTATNAAGAKKLNGYLSAVDLGTRRDRADGTFSYSAFPDWRLSTELQHEHKQGTKGNNVFFYSTSNFAAIQEPVDYDTDRFSANAAYTTRLMQAKISYVFSNFTNNQASFRTLTPFNLTTANLISGYKFTELSLPPSNQEHRIKAQYGFNPDETTHLAVNLSSALQIQNEDFTARLYERTPKISDTSYDGLIKTYYGNVALTSRPIKDWNFRAAYTIDDRDNASQKYKQLPPYRADGTAAFNGSVGVQYNLPYSSLGQRADLEVGYRATKSTKVTLDYSLKDDQRDYGVTNHNQEQTYGGRVQSTLWDGVTGTLGYSRGIRQATQYNGNRGWADLGRNLTGSNSETALRMYTYAARNRDEVKANASWTPAPEVSMGLTGRYVNDQFPGTYYGITDNHILSIGPDITVSITKDISTHFFYTYQENFTSQTIEPSAANNVVIWRLNNNDTVHTAGVRTDWKVSDRLKVTAENNLSSGNTAFEEGGWWRGTGTYTATNKPSSLPDSQSLFNSLKVAGEYEYIENVFLGLSGMWERFVSRDYLNWQAASSAANQTATAAIGAEGNSGYSAIVIMATARLSW